MVSYWKLGFHLESRLGAKSLPIRDTLAMPQDWYSVQPLDPAGPVHTYFCGLEMPEHTFPDPNGSLNWPVATNITEVSQSNNHLVNISAGRSLTPL